MPFEPGLAHVDGHAGLAVGGEGLQEAGIGFDRGAIDVLFLHHQPADAAGRIAAGIHLAAVAVVDAHEGIDVHRRGLDDDHLVEADAGAAVADRGDLGLGEAHGLLARIENDEVVAEPVHLDEGDFARAHCGCIPDPGWKLALIWAETHGECQCRAAFTG